MKIKEQTRKLAAGCTWVRQGEADVVWIWFSKSMNVCFARSAKSTFKDFQDYLSSWGKIVFWYDFHPQNTRGMCYNRSNR